MITQVETKGRIVGPIAMGVVILACDGSLKTTVGGAIGGGIGAALLFWFLGFIAAFSTRRDEPVVTGRPAIKHSVMWRSWRYAFYALVLFALLACAIRLWKELATNWKS